MIINRLETWEHLNCITLLKENFDMPILNEHEEVYENSTREQVSF